MCVCVYISVRGVGTVKLLVLPQPMSTAERITSHEPFPLEGNWKAALLLYTTQCVCVRVCPCVCVFSLIVSVCLCWACVLACMLCCSTHGCVFACCVCFSQSFVSLYACARASVCVYVCVCVSLHAYSCLAGLCSWGYFFTLCVCARVRVWF